MAQNNLNVSVTAGLDKPKSVAQINNDILKIEGQLRKLKLQAQLDGKVTAELQQQIAALNRQKRQLYVDLKIRKNDLKRQYKQAISQVQTQPLNVAVSTANAQKQMSGFSNTIKATKNETETLGGALQAALRNTGLVVSSQTALQLVRKAAQEATEAVKEYDKYATNLSIITNGTRADSDNIIADLSEKSFEFKVDISELENAYETLLRTGKAAGELDDYLKSTVFLSKIGFEDMETSASNLVTIGNAFKLQSDEIENVVSSLVALDILVDIYEQLGGEKKQTSLNDGLVAKLTAGGDINKTVEGLTPTELQQAFASGILTTDSNGNYAIDYNILGKNQQAVAENTAEIEKAKSELERLNANIGSTQSNTASKTDLNSPHLNSDGYLVGADGKQILNDGKPIKAKMNPNIVPLSEVDVSQIKDKQTLELFNVLKVPVATPIPMNINSTTPLRTDTGEIMNVSTNNAPTVNFTVNVDGSADEKTVQAMKDEIGKALLNYTNKMISSLNNSTMRRISKI